MIDPVLEEFLCGLRTAWKESDIRPTGNPKPKQKRSRRRPDPFVRVTNALQAWFDEQPWRTSRELLQRLQAEHPGLYPDHLLRTLQRCMKIWRKDKAHAMVFGAMRDQPANQPMTSRFR